MPRMNRAPHNLSHYRLTTFDMGQLVPVACVEVVMGDSFIHSTAALVRASTLVAPVMHPVDIRVHHWFVPNRVVWSDWDEFITGRDPELTVPTIDVQSGGTYTLLDHLGVPDDPGLINALPIRAYNKIYNEFYRDQDIITAVAEDSVTLKRVGWEKDYFTTCRPNPQQGTAITIPFSAGTEAPLVGRGGKLYFDRASPSTASGVVVRASQAGLTADLTDPYTTVDANDASTETNRNFGLDVDLAPGTLAADLGSVSGGGIDVNEFRMAMAMQRHLEARNRWGSRYQDYLLYHGIRPRDSRIDIPEYLGGGRQTMAFSEVLATAEGTNTAVGDQAGHGIAAMRTRRYKRFFPESGWVLSLMSIRPKTVYADQLHRQWLRSLKDDFWQREYEAFGPQAVLKKEVYGNHASSTEVFGYNGRHDEYRRHPSYVTAGFRSLDDYWHMARFFASAPALNQTFIECTPTDRIYADTSEPEIRAQVSHRIAARRLISKRSRY